MTFNGQSTIIEVENRANHINFVLQVVQRSTTFI